MGLIAGDRKTPPNNPPTWTGTPAPSWESDVGGTYDVSQHAQDPDGDTLIFTTATASPAFPDGVTLATTGILTATTSITEAITSGLLVNVDDGVNNPVTSPAFNVTVTSSNTETRFPLLGTLRISTFNYAQTGELASADRHAIGLMDLVLLGGFFGTNQDDADPGPNYKSRTDITQDILDAHNTAFGNDDIYICTYVNQMETSTTGQFASKIGSETGPNGTDWWYRNQSGDIVASGFGAFVNISDQITPDAQGRNFCDYYNDEVTIPDLMDLHAAAGIGTGKGGMSPWYDNLGIHMRKSGIDPDQDGNNDDMQDYYDPDNATHVATEPKAVQFVGEYRANQRGGVERVENSAPGILLGGNTNQWAQGYSGAASSLTGETHPYIMKEYRLDENDKASKSFTNLGLSENNNWRAEELKSGWMRSHTLWTGVSSNSGGAWQNSYNNIAFPMLNLSDGPGGIPLVFGEWMVDCLDNNGTGPGGRPIWPAEPRTGSAWNAHRWSMATCMLCSAHYCCSGVEDQPTSTNGERRATPLFDEMGLINGSVDYNYGTGSTKLFYKWMGKAVDPIQTTARQGTYLWMREFDNCLVIINTNWDDSDPDETVDVSALPGGASEWKRFNGDQDSSWNDGTDASSDFSIPSIDAIFLVRKSWYDAL